MRNLKKEGIRISDLIVEIGRKHCPDFNLDDPTRRGMYAAVYYCLIGSSKAAEFGLDPRRGILLNGDIGVGKSEMMRVMQQLFLNTRRTFCWVNARHIKAMLRDYSALEILEMYGTSFKNDLYLDDIGIGSESINSWGNVVNIIGEIIMDRSELFVREGFLTHFTCNITTEEIEKIYGDRVFDRMVEMTNLLTWTGKSLRRRDLK